jgi:hypothetical protein
MAIAESQTIRKAEGEPDLHCFDDITWDGVKPGIIVKEIFYVENIGEPLSELDWEITEWPEWGTWYFLPPEGEDLKPNDGAIHVYVFVEIPDQPYTEYTGNVTVVNLENSSDFELVPVYLRCPMTYETPLQIFLKKLADYFPVIGHIFSRFL